MVVMVSGKTVRHRARAVGDAEIRVEAAGVAVRPGERANHHVIQRRAAGEAQIVAGQRAVVAEGWSASVLISEQPSQTAPSGRETEILRFGKANETAVTSASTYALRHPLPGRYNRHDDETRRTIVQVADYVQDEYSGSRSGTAQFVAWGAWLDEQHEPSGTAAHRRRVRSFPASRPIASVVPRRQYAAHPQ
jgi:hypothetical protein